MNSKQSIEEIESKFVDKLIEELPQHGIDTSMWEYNYGDCCDDAVEFMAECIKGYAEQFKAKEQKPITDETIEALTKINQMTDCGSPEATIIRMKEIASEALKLK